MARKKLARFRDNEKSPYVIEPERDEVLRGWPLAGKWRERVFANEQPIVLELGCGKGEYSVALAQRHPEVNHIGIDVKGARIWYGANQAREEKLPNVAFLRTQVELLPHCFAPGEVDEIWITFPDPQIKHSREKHRLTHPAFLEKYRQVLRPGGWVHLKTDSEFLYGYTSAILSLKSLPVAESYFDIDLQLAHDPEHILHQVRTHYEELFRGEGKKITYIRFQLEE